MSAPSIAERIFSISCYRTRPSAEDGGGRLQALAFSKVAQGAVARQQLLVFGVIDVVARGAADDGSFGDPRPSVAVI
jgi:hypothetical protein